MLRLRGVLRKLTNGTNSYYPETQEQARRERVVYYNMLERCKAHPQYMLAFTESGLCTECARVFANNKYELAYIQGEPFDPTEAAHQGKDYYWTRDHGKYCGHDGRKTLDGRCYTCASTPRTPSPRQEAMRAGSEWYMPTDPCQQGHMALRRVRNGSCMACEQAIKQARGTQPDRRRAAPLPADMIMDRETARALGLKRFRTGKPCKNGHLGFRHVATGGCIDCRAANYLK